MVEISMIGLDLAKSVFQVHAVDGAGGVVEKRRLRRGQVLGYFARLSPCVVVMEACGSAHHWGREIAALGHQTKLIAAAYVKPFVQRQKNDAADAAAIVTAARQPHMRFVAVKSADHQAAGLVFRARDLLVRQRTQAVNALRGHLHEFGVIAPAGLAQVTTLRAQMEAAHVPVSARLILDELCAVIADLDRRIATLSAQIKARAEDDDTARRLMTIPGVGPITAAAFAALPPDAQSFQNGRHFAAWLGLAPRQNSSGGKHKLGAITKMGARALRRLLIIGACGLVRWAGKRPPAPGSWLARMIAKKPPMLVIVALANKMARIIWALMARGADYLPARAGMAASV